MPPPDAEPCGANPTAVHLSSTLGVAATDMGALSLPQVFCPGEAAKVLRSLGMKDMTECALRTRAYRKQVPFHVNGRRILFTLGDLQEIAEGEAYRPRSRTPAVTPVTEPRPTMRRRPPPQHEASAGDRWRARSPHCPTGNTAAKGKHA